MERFYKNSYLTHFLNQNSKNKKNHPKIKFLIFWEMKLPSSSIKKFLIFSHISGIGSPQKLFTFQETETLKSFLYFRKYNF